MNRNKRMSKTKRGIVLCIVVLVLFSICPLETRAGNCEKALLNCLYDPFLNIAASIFCLNGYIFCKKYIGG